jgi:uncharacterized protein YcfL
MKTTISFLILLLTVAGGCVTRVERVPLDQPATSPAAPQTQTTQDKRVLMDPALGHVIKVVAIKSTTSPEGYLRIQLNVQNLTGSSRNFTYRIDWLDQDEVALPMASVSWLPWMLLSHETSFLAATSPTPSAKDFRVTFLGPGK